MGEVKPTDVRCPSCLAPAGEPCRLALTFEDDTTTVLDPVPPHPERRLKAAKKQREALS